MKPGDKRVIIKHAIFPVIVNGKWIWFKDYIAYQRCKVIHIEGQRIAPFWTEGDSTHLIWETYKRESIIL